MSLTIPAAIGCRAANADRAGALIIVGGGGTPDGVVLRAIELAGGIDRSIVVLPQASQRATTGDESAAMFREAGARDVRVLRFDGACDADDTARLEQAALIWFPGGDQNRLMKRLDEVGATAVIRRRHREGAAVGGTSAGAAVMSEWMMTGEAKLDAVHRGGTKLAPGLGLWPGVIVDQHFHARRRFNRLLSAVLDQPQLRGVGIDEQTAVIVRGRTCKVMGESSVLVIDARGATANDTGSASARGIRIDVVGAGDPIEF